MRIPSQVLLDWLWEWLQQFLSWLLGKLLWLPKWILSKILDALAALVNAIPVPEAFTQFANSIGSLSGSVVWFLDLLQFKFGVAVISSALLARFLLRRIPGIG